MTQYDKNKTFILVCSKKNRESALQIMEAQKRIEAVVAMNNRAISRLGWMLMPLNYELEHYPRPKAMTATSLNLFKENK